MSSRTASHIIDFDPFRLDLRAGQLQPGRHPGQAPAEDLRGARTPGATPGRAGTEGGAPAGGLGGRGGLRGRRSASPSASCARRSVTSARRRGSSRRFPTRISLHREAGSRARRYPGRRARGRGGLPAGRRPRGGPVARGGRDRPLAGGGGERPAAGRIRHRRAGHRQDDARRHRASQPPSKLRLRDSHRARPVRRAVRGWRALPPRPRCARHARARTEAPSLAASLGARAAAGFSASWARQRCRSTMAPRRLAPRSTRCSVSRPVSTPSPRTSRSCSSSRTCSGATTRPGLLSVVARRRDPARLLVLCTLRPADAIVRGHPVADVKRELLRTGQCREILLGGLSPAEIAAYLAARFSGAELPAVLLPLLVERSAGNPFFMVALVDQLIEQGLLVSNGVRWELRSDVEQVCERRPRRIAGRDRAARGAPGRR